jgi:hypothetical protein
MWLEAIILKTMMKDQTGRFPSVAILLQELDRCLTSAGRPDLGWRCVADGQRRRLGPRTSLPPASTSSSPPPVTCAADRWTRIA